MSKTAELPEKLADLLSRTETENMEGDLPLVTLAYAQSLDGSIAAKAGMPLEISGPKSLEVTHRLRARHQAIMIGVGTLLADNPQLNVRLVPGEDPQPVVLDNQLRFPLDARLLEGKKPPWIVTSDQASSEREDALVRAGARIFRASEGSVVLNDVLRVLGQEGIRSVMVEGGAQVITTFLRSRLVKVIVITISPLLIGGQHAIKRLLAPKSMQPSSDGFPRLEPFGIQRFDEDLLVWGCPRWVLEKEK